MQLRRVAGAPGPVTPEAARPVSLPFRAEKGGRINRGVWRRSRNLAAHGRPLLLGHVSAPRFHIFHREGGAARRRAHHFDAPDAPRRMAEPGVRLFDDSRRHVRAAGQRPGDVQAVCPSRADGNGSELAGCGFHRPATGEVERVSEGLQGAGRRQRVARRRANSSVVIQDQRAAAGITQRERHRCRIEATRCAWRRWRLAGGVERPSRIAVVGGRAATYKVSVSARFGLRADSLDSGLELASAPALYRGRLDP
jgi:hypothetical protein